MNSNRHVKSTKFNNMQTVTKSSVMCIPTRPCIPEVRYSGGPPFRTVRRKKLYKGLVVRVSASYRPSSKVVGCGGGVWGGGRAPSPGKKIFLYTGSVVRVSARSSLLTSGMADRNHVARLQHR